MNLDLSPLSTSLSTPCCGSVVALVDESPAPVQGPRLEVRSVWECQCCGRLWETVLALRPAVAREVRVRRLMAQVAG